MLANASLERASRVVDVEAALDRVTDGMTVGIGGFINSSHPMVVVRGLIRRKVRNLTVVGAASSGLEVDMLIAAGCVRRVVAPYVGGEALAAIGPAFRARAQAGEIEVYELDEAMYYAGLRAAAQRVPFNPWRSGVGTSYPEVNKHLKLFSDPINGETLLAIPAINIDVAFVHAAYSDLYGNVQYVGTGYGDRALYAAADVTIAQVERIVSNEEIRRDPLRTAIPGADAVVKAPYGAHPFSSPGFYREHREHIAEYVAAGNALVKSGDRSAIDQYLQEYVFGPHDHFAYLEKIGVRAFLTLDEY